MSTFKKKQDTHVIYCEAQAALSLIAKMDNPKILRRAVKEMRKLMQEIGGVSDKDMKNYSRKWISWLKCASESPNSVTLATLGVTSLYVDSDAEEEAQDDAPKKSAPVAKPASAAPIKKEEKKSEPAFKKSVRAPPAPVVDEIPSDHEDEMLKKLNKKTRSSVAAVPVTTPPTSSSISSRLPMGQKVKASSFSEEPASALPSEKKTKKKALPAAKAEDEEVEKYRSAPVTTLPSADKKKIKKKDLPSAKAEAEAAEAEEEAAEAAFKAESLLKAAAKAKAKAAKEAAKEAAAAAEAAAAEIAAKEARLAKAAAKADAIAAANEAEKKANKKSKKALPSASLQKKKKEEEPASDSEHEASSSEEAHEAPAPVHKSPIPAYSAAAKKGVEEAKKNPPPEAKTTLAKMPAPKSTQYARETKNFMNGLQSDMKAAHRAGVLSAVKRFPSANTAEAMHREDLFMRYKMNESNKMDKKGNKLNLPSGVFKFPVEGACGDWMPYSRHIVDVEVEYCGWSSTAVTYDGLTQQCLSGIAFQVCRKFVGGARGAADPIWFMIDVKKGQWRLTNGEEPKEVCIFIPHNQDVPREEEARYLISHLTDHQLDKLMTAIYEEADFLLKRKFGPEFSLETPLLQGKPSYNANEDYSSLVFDEEDEDSHEQSQEEEAHESSQEEEVVVPNPNSSEHFPTLGSPQNKKAYTPVREQPVKKSAGSSDSSAQNWSDATDTEDEPAPVAPSAKKNGKSKKTKHAAPKKEPAPTSDGEKDNDGEDSSDSSAPSPPKKGKAAAAAATSQEQQDESDESEDDSAMETMSQLQEIKINKKKTEKEPQNIKESARDAVDDAIAAIDLDDSDDEEAAEKKDE